MPSSGATKVFQGRLSTLERRKYTKIAMLAMVLQQDDRRRSDTGPPGEQAGVRVEFQNAKITTTTATMAVCT